MLLKQCTERERCQIIILKKHIRLFLSEQISIGDWQGGFEKGYAASRNPESGHMSHHVQFEANMSLTGANADKPCGNKTIGPSICAHQFIQCDHR